MCEHCHLKYILALFVFLIGTAVSFVYEAYSPGPTPEVSVLFFFGGAVLSMLILVCDMTEQLPGERNESLISYPESGPQYIYGYGPAAPLAASTKHSYVHTKSLATGGKTSVQH